MDLRGFCNRVPWQASGDGLDGLHPVPKDEEAEPETNRVPVPARRSLYRESPLDHATAGVCFSRLKWTPVFGPLGANA